MIFGGLVTTDEKIANNSEEIEKVAKSVQDAIKFIKKNPRETKELIFEYFGLEQNEDNKKTVDDVYSLFAQCLLSDGVPQEEGITKLIQYVKAGQFESFEDLDNQTVSPEEIDKSFDFRFLDAN
jgi:ABC-type nitrate/sulfonate/bicarbonate transport system substrate-binding protein